MNVLVTTFSFPSGKFIRTNEVFLREKANRYDDPRHVFYEAMLSNNTYEAYEAAIRGISVEVSTHRTGSITGRMEILYARRRGWIVDAKRLQRAATSESTSGGQDER